MTEYAEPPAYPFPNDEILYPRRKSWGDFDLETDSYFALGRIPEDQSHVFNDREHRNYLRFVIRTPEKGSMAVLANHGDMQHLAVLSLLGTLETMDKVRTEPVDNPSISLEWLASMMGRDADEVFV